MSIPPTQQPPPFPAGASGPAPRAARGSRTVSLTIGILAALLVIALSAGGIWYLGTSNRSQSGVPAATSTLVPPTSADPASPPTAPAPSTPDPSLPSPTAQESSGAPSSAAVPSPVSLSAVPPPPKTTATVTVTKPPTTTRPPSSATAPRTTLRYQGSDQLATFRYFTALLSGDPVRNGADPTELRLYVVVCVKELPPGSAGGVTRVSRDSWSVRNSKGQSGVVRQTSLTPTFPAESTGGVGACFDGYLSFTTPAGFFDNSTGIDVMYANGVGETAVWSFH